MMLGGQEEALLLEAKASCSGSLQKGLALATMLPALLALGPLDLVARGTPTLDIRQSVNRRSPGPRLRVALPPHEFGPKRQR